MLKTLKLTCFRKAEQADMQFGPGLTVIRGANEASKSTRIEAIAYALFGTSALRNSLEETVTWGHKPADLKVELHFGEYIFARSKAGAEVIKGGNVFVTGQKEVSVFAASLLGADAATANLLMFANQGSLRGVLETGPKGTGELLETVAGLDLFDKLLDAASEQLATGSTAALTSRLEVLTAQRAGITAPAEPDKVAFDKAVAAMEAEDDKLEAEIRELDPILNAKMKLYEDEIYRRNDHDELSHEMDKLSERIKVAEDEIDSLIVGQVQDTSTLEASIASIESEDRVRQAWEIFRSLPTFESTSRTVVDSMIDGLNRRIDEDTKLAREMDTKVAVLQAQLVTSSLCGFCGQDIAQFPEAAKKNELLKAEIETVKLTVACARARCEEHQREVSKLQKIVADDLLLMKGVARIEDYVEIDTTAIPAILMWRGGDVGPQQDKAALTAQLQEIRAANDSAIKAGAKRETLVEALAKLKGEVEAYAVKRRAITLMTYEAFTELAYEVEALRTKALAIEIRQKELTAEYQALIQSYQQMVREWADYQDSVYKLDADISQTKADIAGVEFNNALVKKIRSARPVVTAKLWNMILASVSTLFSKVRGEQSLVERGPKGFTINGKDVASLSGSTLDLLGLCVRVSLIKTFMPTCPFLILDEPGAGMSQNRTESMLGFLSSIGFSQTLLITHDPISESYADTLIELT